MKALLFLICKSIKLTFPKTPGEEMRGLEWIGYVQTFPSGFREDTLGAASDLLIHQAEPHSLAAPVGIPVL